MISNGEEFERITGYVESYYSDDTYQFTDYSKYDANYFDEKEKREHREQQFPFDMQKCFEMGASMVGKVRELNK